MPHQGRGLRQPGGEPGRAAGGAALGPGERLPGRQRGSGAGVAFRRSGNGQPGGQLEPTRRGGALEPQGAPEGGARDAGSLRIRSSPGGIRGCPEGPHRGLHHHAAGTGGRGAREGSGRGGPGADGVQRRLQDQPEGRALGDPGPGGPHGQDRGPAHGQPLRSPDQAAQPALRVEPALGPARWAAAGHGGAAGGERQRQRGRGGRGG